MEQSKKNVMKLVLILAVYILFSALGIFNQIGAVLLPIFALPFALYCMRNKVSISTHIFFHVVISLVIYLFTPNPYCILIYIVGVIVPTYIILFLYKQNLSLPNIMMYTGLSLAAVVFGYFIIMRHAGIDFEKEFMLALDEVNKIFSSQMDNIVQMGNVANMNMSMSELKETVALMKQLMAVRIEALKASYAALIVLQMVVASGISVTIFNVLARRKDRSLPSTKEIVEFRVSKIAVGLLLLSMLTLDLNQNAQGAILSLNINIRCFLMNLFMIAGVLALIGLLSRTTANGLIKVIGYIAIAFMFVVSPYIIMFFGCLDAIFNYRKVKIVV